MLQTNFSATKDFILESMQIFRKANFIILKNIITLNRFQLVELTFQKSKFTACKRANLNLQSTDLYGDLCSVFMIKNSDKSKNDT